MKQFVLGSKDLNEIVNNMQDKFDMFAPRLFKGEGRFSDSDKVDYARIETFDEIFWDAKSLFSAKEFLLPVTEDLVEISSEGVSRIKKTDRRKLVFLRSCDLNAVSRMDKHFFSGKVDTDYQLRREKVFFVLMECEKSWDSCFCKMMETDKSNDFDMKIRLLENGSCQVVIRNSSFDNYFSSLEAETCSDMQTDRLEADEQFYTILTEPGDSANKPELWSEAGRRCIGCGACNFACPTCFCFGMRDEVTGEKSVRQRVWSSCQVKGFAKVNGNFEFRSDQKDKVRFKFLHKFKYFKKKHGVNLCVGCGRCVDVCPEYLDIRKQVMDVNLASSKQPSEVRS